MTDEKIMMGEHRSWFAYPDGRVVGGKKHRDIMKSHYKTYWDELKNASEEDAAIERTLEGRLLNTGVVLIGEMGDFYVIVRKLNKENEGIIRRFARLITDGSQGIREKNVRITQKMAPGERMECTMGELADDRWKSKND